MSYLEAPLYLRVHKRFNMQHAIAGMDILELWLCLLMMYMDAPSHP